MSTEYVPDPFSTAGRPLHNDVVCDSKVISDTKLVDKVKAKVREVIMSVDTTYVLGITKVVEVIKVADNTKMVNQPLMVTSEGHKKG